MYTRRDFSTSLYNFHENPKLNINSLDGLCRKAKKFYFDEFEKIDDTEFSSMRIQGKLVSKEQVRYELNKLICACIRAIKKSNNIQGVLSLYKLLFDENGKLRYKGCSTEIDAGTNFYRVREAEKYVRYDLNGIFAIDDNHKDLVGQYRFNQAGNSCLYLASNLYLAWEECRRPDFTTVNFSLFKSTRKLKVLDLTISNTFSEYGNFIISFITLLCSAKANDKNKYKFQYVVPGIMMMLLARSQDKMKYKSSAYAGIRYLSSRRFDCEDFLFEGRSLSTAFVFPQRPHKVKESLCPFLKNSFRITPPRSYFLYRSHCFDFKVSSTWPSDYSHSIFGQLEAQLNKEKLEYLK